MPVRLLLVLLLALSGSGTLRAAPLHRLPPAGEGVAKPAPMKSPPAQPDIIQSHNLHPFWAHLPIPAQDTWGITAGPDGNEWVSDNSTMKMYRIQMDGTVATFSTPSFNPYYLTTGLDGRIWITGGKAGESVAAMTTDGTFTVYQSPSGDHPYGGSELAVGPDNNVWFAEGGHIASVTASGTVAEYAYPSGQTQNYYPSVTLGPDHRIWFTESAYNGGILGAIDTTTHKIVEYGLPYYSCGLIFGLAAGGDGNLYAVCSGDAFRVTTAGKVLRKYSMPEYLPTATSSTIEAPDGRVWISFGSSYGLIDVYSRGGEIVKIPNPFARFTSIAMGPDGNVWGMGKVSVNVYLRNRLSVEPHQLHLHAMQSMTLHAAYRGQSALSAASANPSVATVTAGKSANQFIVTGVATGSTTITIADPLGNFYNVPVTVK